jgi:putative flavoprotein involved in K+ transport
MNRLLDRLDAWAQSTDADVDPPERFQPTQVLRPLLEVDLHRSGISTVLFATGFRPDYSWLDPPVLDRRSRIVHDGGVITGAPGCYVVGLNILRRRRSSYVSGAARDSADIARLLQHHLDVAARPRSRVRQPTTRSVHDGGSGTAR